MAVSFISVLLIESERRAAAAALSTAQTLRSRSERRLGEIAASDAAAPAERAALEASIGEVVYWEDQMSQLSAQRAAKTTDICAMVEPDEMNWGALRAFMNVALDHLCALRNDPAAHEPFIVQYPSTESVPLYESWEKRFYAACAAYRARVSTARTALVEALVAVAKECETLTADPLLWSALVELVASAFLHVAVYVVTRALQRYAALWQGKGARELFALQLQLNSSCTPQCSPKASDLVSLFERDFAERIASCFDGPHLRELVGRGAVAPAPRVDAGADVSITALCDLPVELQRWRTCDGKGGSFTGLVMSDSGLVSGLNAVRREVAKAAASVTAIQNELISAYGAYWSTQLVSMNDVDTAAAVTEIEAALLTSPLGTSQSTNGALLVDYFGLLDTALAMLRAHTAKLREQERLQYLEAFALGDFTRDSTIDGARNAGPASVVPETQPPLAALAPAANLMVGDLIGWLQMTAAANRVAAPGATPHADTLLSQIAAAEESCVSKKVKPVPPPVERVAARQTATPLPVVPLPTSVATGPPLSLPANRPPADIPLYQSILRDDSPPRSESPAEPPPSAPSVGSVPTQLNERVLAAAAPRASTSLEVRQTQAPSAVVGAATPHVTRDKRHVLESAVAGGASAEVPLSSARSAWDSDPAAAPAIPPRAEVARRPVAPLTPPPQERRTGRAMGSAPSTPVAAPVEPVKPELLPPNVAPRDAAAAEEIQRLLQKERDGIARIHAMREAANAKRVEADKMARAEYRSSLVTPSTEPAAPSDAIADMVDREKLRVAQLHAISEVPSVSHTPNVPTPVAPAQPSRPTPEAVAAPVQQRIEAQRAEEEAAAMAMATVKAQADAERHQAALDAQAEERELTARLLNLDRGVNRGASTVPEADPIVDVGRFPPPPSSAPAPHFSTRMFPTAAGAGADTLATAPRTAGGIRAAPPATTPHAQTPNARSSVDSASDAAPRAMPPQLPPPDSALRRKLALPATAERPRGVDEARAGVEPGTPVVGGTGAKAALALATVSAQVAATPMLTAEEREGLSLHDIYRAACQKAGLKPNSGLIRLLPKEPGRNVSTLNLDLNYIGNRGFLPLLEVLRCNRGLTLLNLKDNNLENAEIRALCDVLLNASGEELCALDLSNNPISLPGAHSILELVQRRRTLTTLALRGTLVQQTVVEQIMELARRNDK